MRVAQIQAPSEHSRLCGIVLRDLPEWFGIGEATAAYVRDVTNLPTLGIGDALLSLMHHTPRTAEVYVMGVTTGAAPEVGTALLEAAEEYLRGRDFECLQVKTLGLSRPDERCEGTRCFYEARGFVPLEEIHGLWGTTRACSP